VIALSLEIPKTESELRQSVLSHTFNFFSKRQVVWVLRSCIKVLIVSQLRKVGCRFSIHYGGNYGKKRKFVCVVTHIEDLSCSTLHKRYRWILPGKSSLLFYFLFEIYISFVGHTRIVVTRVSQQGLQQSQLACVSRTVRACYGCLEQVPNLIRSLNRKMVRPFGF